jgi:hypothetical protein
MTNNAMLVPLARCPKQLVTDYTVELEGPDGRKTSFEINGNFQRRRVHRFSACEVRRVRIEVRGSGDGKTARIFEVRLYHDEK